MALFFQIHDTHPQLRLIRQVVDVIEKGGVIVYPTDSGYALGCSLGEKQALERIRRIRNLDEKHHFTLVCQDLSEISAYAKVDNANYRLLKSHTPGPYTFILKGTKEVPNRLLQAKRKTVGFRAPDNVIARAILAELGAPLMSVSLILPGDEQPVIDPYEMKDRLDASVDLIIDGGYAGMEPTSVIDISEDTPILIRKGLGDVSAFVD
jgi:tRNA threonylcarbamoyl adenosine modification protein (Sua5/YciO/YrdC/YwlC family)